MSMLSGDGFYKQSHTRIYTAPIRKASQTTWHTFAQGIAPHECHARSCCETALEPIHCRDEGSLTASLTTATGHDQAHVGTNIAKVPVRADTLRELCGVKDTLLGGAPGIDDCACTGGEARPLIAREWCDGAVRPRAIGSCRQRLSERQPVPPGNRVIFLLHQQP
jgi:hypothetical protein